MSFVDSSPPVAPVSRAPAIRRASALALAAVSAMLGVTCGGGSSPPSPSPPGNGNPLTFTITATGVSPRTMTVPNGSRVVFVNNDTRPHNMTSDPHPTHEDCPELNQIGFLAPGQQREGGNLVQSRVCGFHDHDNPGSASLQGSITIR